ncbi:uncharacterized protein LOC111080547 isoform X1 [Drosophila obscura]|uniref:uncharacterized protein LOC111080547 isoform X1 n=1 Tax=Drosophila obscura TaxID=7282 RepID=UPI001BB1352F|nr:uncharacterized protein LOC111080547 isoform X1 [Drosophila obscura]
MYAAAGGASLASRQARQKQRQEKKNKILQAKLHPPKAPGAVGLDAGDLAGGASTPTRSASRQFHHLPTTYLRAPQALGRKLSATYTTQSKLLLPIDEGDTQSVLQLRMHSHSHAHPHAHSHGPLAHGHAHAHSHLQPSHLLGAAAITPGPPQTPYQQFASSHGRVSPKLVHRHSGSSAGFHPAAAAAAAGQLHKSATATLPLVSHMDMDMEAALPSAVVGVKTTATPTSPPLASTSAAAAAASAGAAIEVELAGAAAMFVPHHDAIIVTPATPMASPGHVTKLRRPGPEEEVPETAAERQPLTAGEAYDEDEPMHPPPGQLERKCSVYRMRRSDAFEDGDGDGGVTGGLKRQLRELQFSTGVQQTQYEPLLTDEPQLLFKGLGNGRKWQICAYCEEGICVCEHLECAQGRAAWLERGRRCSVQDQQQQQATLSRRWVKRNRIQDASLGGSSDDEDFLGVLRGPSTFANAFLYVGLGTVALGLVIAFVGTGEKGFKTVELRLIGPSLIGIGLICCILRILFCICPSHCISSSKKARKKNGNKIDADHTTSLLRNESKRVSIARGTSVQPKYPIAHKRSQSKMLNEGMEALRQIATTSLFMQNDQKTAINRVVPIINEPDSGDAPLEMKKLQTALSACEMSEEEQEEKARQQRQIAKRTTTATTAVTSSTTKDPTTTTIPTKAARATTLSTVDERPDSKLVRQRVALQQQRQQPQQQQQVKQEQHPAQQVSKSQSLSSSSTVKDSLDGMVVVEETSLIDATSVATGTVPVPAAAPVSVAASAPAPLPSSCSTGAIPRLKTNNSVSFTSSQATRPGISTGATPKTTPTSARLPTSQSHPTSYDLPPALPHTYSASATVRGPLGMSMSTSTYAMPTSKVGPLAAAAAASATSSAYAAMPPTTTTISLLPLPAPPTMATAMHSIPGQVPEGGTNTTTTTHTASLSLSLMQPTPMRPSSASSMAMSTSSFSTENKSHPSSASTTRGRGGQLLAPPKALTSTSTASTSTSSKCEPELVLSPAKLGQ